MKYEIKMATTQDAEAFTDHFLVHAKEKGIGGVMANPYPVTHQWNREEYKANLVKKWSLPFLSPGFEIVWLAIVDGKTIGHLDLRCGGIDAQKHRLRLGMGLQANYRSMGIGKELMKTAIEWAKKQNQISWIDLSVFAKNMAARNFYRASGFQELLIIKDALRVDGESIDDVQMTLKVKD